MLLLGCTKQSQSTGSAPIVLAVVAKDTIRENDLRGYIQTLEHSKVDLQNEKTRQALLQDMVQNKLVYYYALDNKLNENIEVKFDVITKRDELYYDKLLRYDIYYAMIGDEELRSFYDRLKTEIRIQQIFIGYKNPSKTFVIDKNASIRSREDAKLLADSLYHALEKKPQLFGEFAEAFSNDQNSKYLSGDIGYKRWGMRPDLEKSVFDLKMGDISAPIEADYGYYLFRITDKRNVENLQPLDEDVNGIKNMMLPYLFREHKNEIDYRKRMLSDSLLAAYKFSISKSNCDHFLTKYSGIKLAADISAIFNETENNLELAVFKNGTITIGELVHAMKNNSKKISMDYQTLADGLRTVVVRRIFSDQARNKHYALNHAEEESLRNYESSRMIDLAVRQLFNGIEIKNTDIEEYYETNKEEYRDPGTINIAEIASANQPALLRISDEFKKTNNFDQTYNQAQQSKEFKCRKIGPISESSSDEIVQRAVRLNVGAVSEPFMKFNKESAIIKVTDRKKGNIIPFSKLKDRVSQDFMNFKHQITYNEWIAKLSAQYKVQIFPERLKSVFDIQMK